MKMPSNMSHSFSNNPEIKTPRSVFNRSFTHKTAFDAGYLIPLYVDDVMPGDTFNVNATLLARLSNPLAPVMDNLYLDSHFFFVPLRLVWSNSKKFFGERTDPADNIDFVLPTFTSFTPTAETLHDYMGLPVGKAQTPVSLYHRAYNLIWNEWFRDQNLQDSIMVDTGDGPDNSIYYVLKRRGKRHDYFTSCLPWPQKGDAVTLPLGTVAPVERVSNAAAWLGYQATTDTLATGAPTNIAIDASSNIEKSGSYNLSFDPNGGLQANLTTATAATINDLREAFQVQKLIERDARGGTRYSEVVANHFGVNFYDVSYRPEYLGGGSTPINISAIANTTTAGGDFNAIGVGVGRDHGFNKTFLEHGIVIGLVSVRADLTYQQGMNRRYLRSTRYDFYWPSLAHLGEQAITNAEIYFQATAADNDVFGYQERYAEYRYYPSMITGSLRSTHATPLDVWHLSQEFSTLPTLGDTFIRENPPVDRVSAVPTEPNFILDSYFKMLCARPMPVFSVPGYIDHF